jgi:hypothetical protein
VIFISVSNIGFEADKLMRTPSGAGFSLLRFALARPKTHRLSFTALRIEKPVLPDF